MTLCQTQIQEAIIKIPPSPPSEQITTPRIQTPITMTPSWHTITFNSPSLTQDQEQLTQFYINKFQAEDKLCEQQAADGFSIEEVEAGEVHDKPLKQDKGKGHELTTKIPKEFQTQTLPSPTPTIPASNLSALDLTLTVPPPQYNVYFNNGFMTTEKATYNNMRALSSKKPLTPSQTQLPLPPFTSSCSAKEFWQWMEDTGFWNDLRIETKGTLSNNKQSSKA